MEGQSWDKLHTHGSSDLTGSDGQCMFPQKNTAGCSLGTSMALLNADSKEIKIKSMLIFTILLQEPPIPAQS